MSVSIIIPSTGDRTNVLVETLNAAICAVESIEAEIIVIKNKAKIIALDHPKLRLVDVEFNNVSKSRNAGAELANYDLLFFIDDDILITADNLLRLIEFERAVAEPYVVSATWIHSLRVQELQENTFLGQMLATYFPDDSFENRYKKAAEINDWQEGTYFKSAMKNIFWEMSFSMRRKDYLFVGGMNESYSFGYEGVDFLKRLLSAGISYYVDSTNIVMHNEWDKFNDWNIPEKRWQVEAQLINDNKGDTAFNYKNSIHKMTYGTIVYAFKPLLQRFLYASTVKRKNTSFYFKIFDVYSMSIYWNKINWKTILKK